MFYKEVGDVTRIVGQLNRDRRGYFVVAEDGRCLRLSGDADDLCRFSTVWVAGQLKGRIFGDYVIRPFMTPAELLEGASFLQSRYRDLALAHARERAARISPDTPEKLQWERIEALLNWPG